MYTRVLIFAYRAPSEEAAFVLRCFSGTPLEVEQLPSPLSLVLGECGVWWYCLPALALAHLVGCQHVSRYTAPAFSGHH
jgi:hypothetical protein